MKKAFYHLLSVLSLGMLLSSCLGDTESYLEDSSYGVINTTNGIKFLTVNSSRGLYNISSPSIANYNVGDLIYSNYKIKLDSNLGYNVFDTYFVTANPDEVYLNSDQEVVQKTTPTSSDQYKLKSLNIGVAPINEYLLYRTSFTYSVSLKQGESTTGLEFFYDETNQEEFATETNKSYTIDVRPKVVGSVTGTETKTHTGTTAVNFSNFKEIANLGNVTEAGASVTLKFRYYQEDSTTPKTLLTSILYTKAS